MSDIQQRVKKIIAEQLDIDEAQIKYEASFANDLGADSLEIVALMMALGEEFDIDIPEQAAEKITTVQKAIDYVGTHAKSSPTT